MADGGSLFARKWKLVSRERYRKLCLLIRLQRMMVRGAPHPSVENGRAFDRWHARIVQLENYAKAGGWRWPQ